MIVRIAIYITCIAIAVCLIIILYRKYKDPNFLLGIFFSCLLNLLLLLSAFVFYFLPIVYLLGFIFGIVGGFINTNRTQGAFSGALGILLSWILNVALTFFSLIILFAVDLFLAYIIPSILCGAIGGIVGSKIREKRETAEKKLGKKII